jgi:hypothetical protein
MWSAGRTLNTIATTYNIEYKRIAHFKRTARAKTVPLDTLRRSKRTLQTLLNLGSDNYEAETSRTPAIGQLRLGCRINSPPPPNDLPP